MNNNTELPIESQEYFRTILKELIREELNQFKQEIIEILESNSEQSDRAENYQPNELLRPAQAAPILNISTKTLGRWRQKGTIPSTLIERHYFYKYSDIQAIIEKQPKLDYSFSKEGANNSKPGRPSLLKTLLN